MTPVTDHSVVMALVAIVGTFAAAIVWVVKILVRHFIRAVDKFEAFERAEDRVHDELLEHCTSMMTAQEQSLRNHETMMRQQDRQIVILEQVSQVLNRLADGGAKN
jgi:hypothetical protein